MTDENVDLTEEQMAANAEAAAKGAPKKRLAVHKIPPAIDSRQKPTAKAAAVRSKLDAAEKAKKAKAKASKPDPVETAPKPPKGKPKPATTAPVPKQEPVEAKAPKTSAAGKAALKKYDPPSKGVVIENMLREPGGATIAQMVASTGWQAHSIRAYVTATLGKKRGLPIKRTKAEGKDAVSVYRIEAETAEAF